MHPLKYRQCDFFERFDGNKPRTCEACTENEVSPVINSFTNLKRISGSSAILLSSSGNDVQGSGSTRSLGYEEAMIVSLIVLVLEVTVRGTGDLESLI